MTFRQFIEQSLSDFEGHLRRERAEAPDMEMRLRGARQFALLLLGEPPEKGDTTKGDTTARRSQGADPSTRRFGGPR
jgi:hypothetical protein